MRNFILLASVAFILYSCGRASFITKEEFIDTNKDINVAAWEDWWIACRPSTTYYMAKFNKGNDTLPHFIFFRYQNSIIVRFPNKGKLCTSTIDELEHNAIWNEKFRYIDVTDLKKKAEWVYLNDVNLVKFDNDTLFVKCDSFAVKIGVCRNESHYQFKWEDWPDGEFKNQ